MTKHIMEPEKPKGGPDNDLKVLLWFIAGLGGYVILVLEILKYA